MLLLKQIKMLLIARQLIVARCRLKFKYAITTINYTAIDCKNSTLNSSMQQVTINCRKIDCSN